MPHARFNGDEIASRGEALYEQRIRQQVELEENIGKLLAIDIETGAYAIGDDPVAISRKLLKLHPGAATWTRRIGYDAVYAVGGTRTRTAS